ncbi:hypothetical protein [Mucisphaera calidilacus]|uniref:Uncharacterized protein n=1 Tax=Mucisphaera calidilacus TaxID=2527982 RepID=A0A518BVN0_9BACT|nr:hypothetical protein [Mucisphaera calidilacus]QDU71040.1 hypothetical protein Pan265_08850 [Mucisphaera calidilacus]
MLDLRIKDLFFDTRAVRRRVDHATRAVLSRFGAFVRRTARSSIRKRKRISEPGSPPSSHTGLLKKFIFVGYDPKKNSVVIGPARLSGSARGQAPGLLEYGDSTTLTRSGQRRRVTIRARPFMGPAFDKELPKLPSLWRDSVIRP